MLPLTLDCPKPLLPVGPRSLVEHQVESVVAAGAERVVLATGYRREDFAEVVSRLRAKGVDLTAVEEETPLGTGGALRAALRALPGAQEVVVLNGDLITGHDLRAQLDRLREAPASVLACLHVRKVPDPQRYGSVVLEETDHVRAFVEKSPTPPSPWINAGTYVVRGRLVERLPGEGVVSLERDVFPALVERSSLLAHREDAYFLDVGSPEALVAANRDHVLGRAPGSRPHGEALILPGAEVSPFARVDDGSVIHPGAVLAPGAGVSGSLVLPGAHVGRDATVRACVLGRSVRVGAAAHLDGCALGTGETVAPGARLEHVTRPSR